MWYQSNPIHTVKSVGLCILRERGYDLFLETFLDFFAFA